MILKLGFIQIYIHPWHHCPSGCTEAHAMNNLQPFLVPMAVDALVSIVPCYCPGAWQGLTRLGLLDLGCLLRPFSMPPKKYIENIAALEGAW